jgi:hypothetical protein
VADLTLTEALDTLVRAGRVKSAWLDGMAASIRFRDHPCGGIENDRMRVRVRIDGDGGPDLSEFHWMRIPYSEHDPRHDTSDPITVMGLLLLAREAWGEPGLYCRPTIGRAGWIVMHTDKPIHDWRGDTEAGAIISALVAAAREVAGG